MATDDEKSEALEAFLKDSLHAIESLEAVERLSAEEKEEEGEDVEEETQDSKAHESDREAPETEFLDDVGLLGRISGLTSSAFRFARRTTDSSLKVGRALMRSQDQLKLMIAAGESLRDLRQVAGLTVNELGDALNLRDKSILEAVENGTATLSFELILRLAAVLARNDPLPFILKYTRTYNPELWKIMNDWGVGRLPLQYERERQFVNIFRSHDAARKLSDEGFQQVLDFTRKSFDMSLHFVAEQENRVQEALDAIAEEQEQEEAEAHKAKSKKGKNNGHSGKKE
ncbi:helix-turn-helix transcriptional regulator [Marinobacteraceae bacterium S3BR75-40.1]